MMQSHDDIPCTFVLQRERRMLIVTLTLGILLLPIGLTPNAPICSVGGWAGRISPSP